MSLNHKILLVAATITLSTLSLSAFAQPTSICSDSLQRVCKETELQRLERDRYVAKLKSEISAEAEKSSAPRIEEMKKQIKPIHFIKRFIQSTKIRNQEIMRSAKKRIGDLESVVTSTESVGKIKDYMYQAIDQSKFEEEKKLQLKSIVKTIVVGNFADFIERTGLEDSVLSQFLSNACGSDGLIDNAFATTLKGDRYVLVCPGFLITVNQTSNQAEKFNTILQAIAHEFAHHIDNSKVGSELYAPYLNCLSKNYPEKFKRTKEDEKYCKSNEKDPTKCNSKVILSHAGELIADQWGIKVTALHANSEKYSVADAESMLTESWAKLCGTGDEGIHPTGDFRIGTLMRKNPDINAYLGCNSSEVDTTPSCTLEGEVAL